MLTLRSQLPVDLIEVSASKLNDISGSKLGFQPVSIQVRGRMNRDRCVSEVCGL